jgi:hypothetical protein
VFYCCSRRSTRCGAHIRSLIPSTAPTGGTHSQLKILITWATALASRCRSLTFRGTLPQTLPGMFNVCVCVFNVCVCVRVCVFNVCEACVNDGNSLQVFVHAHTHARTHTHTQQHTHTHTAAAAAAVTAASCAHAHTHAHTHALSLSLTHTHTNAASRAVLRAFQVCLRCAQVCPRSAQTCRACLAGPRTMTWSMHGYPPTWSMIVQGCTNNLSLLMSTLSCRLHEAFVLCTLYVQYQIYMYI